MQVGFIRQEQMQNKQTKEVYKWLECHFRVPGVRPFKAKMSKNKNKVEGDNTPDFILYHRSNVNKGDRFRDVPIGSLWLGSKFMDGVEKKFMTGKCWLGTNEVSIAVWKAEARFEGEVLGWEYDVSIMKDRPRDEGDGGYEESYSTSAQQQQGYAGAATGANNAQVPTQEQPQHAVTEVDVDDDEIPF